MFISRPSPLTEMGVSPVSPPPFSEPPPTDRPVIAALFTPGISNARPRKSLPFNWSSWISVPVIVPLDSPLEVSTWTAAASTVTSLTLVPTLRVTFSVTCGLRVGPRCARTHEDRHAKSGDERRTKISSCHFAPSLENSAKLKVGRTSGWQLFGSPDDRRVRQWRIFDWAWHAFCQALACTHSRINRKFTDAIHNA